MSSVRENRDRVRERVASAAQRGQRDPASVHTIAVTKKQPLERLEDAFAAGLVHFGENYAQELAEKAPKLPAGVQWHFIGRLQRNKVRHVVGIAALIHAVDSVSLLDEIEKRAAAASIVQECLLAVNIAGEAGKGGVEPTEASELLAHARRLEHVRCSGLMTMPPWPEEPEDNRLHFRRLRELRDELGLEHLSMGTSGDFEVAVEEGATWIRVGTALLGPRVG